MSTATLDPKLATLSDHLKAAFAGTGGASSNGGYASASTSAATSRDSTILASSLLAAYQSAIVANPSKAFKATSATPRIQLSSVDEATSKDFWSGLWNVVQIAGPAVVNALSKDYKPETPTLATIMADVPAHRRNDKDWVDFTTNLLLSLAQGTMQSLSGQKDLSNEANQPAMPTPPAGADKSWFSDAFDVVTKYAPTVLPIAMSLL